MTYDSDKSSSSCTSINGFNSLQFYAYTKTKNKNQIPTAKPFDVEIRLKCGVLHPVQWPGSY